jgi:transcriptional regulator with XRE-family HTH domain
MVLAKVVAVNLRRLRHAKGLTQEELAQKARLSTRYIGAIERAEVSVSVTVLGQITDALEVDASMLVRALPSRSRNLTPPPRRL